MIFSNLMLNFSPILFFPIVQCSKIPWYQFELHGSTTVQTSPLSYLFRCSEICYQKWLGLLILGPPLSRVFLHSKNLIPSFKLVSYYQFVLKIPVPPLHVPTCPHTPPPHPPTPKIFCTTRPCFDEPVLLSQFILSRIDSSCCMRRGSNLLYLPIVNCCQWILSCQTSFIVFSPHPQFVP